MEDLSDAVLGGSGAALWRPGVLFGSPGAALGAYGRLVGPKWPPGWAQVAAKWPQEPPRGRQKAAKRWFLEQKNGPKRSQRAIKRGRNKQISKTSKLITFLMKMFVFRFERV